MKEPGTGFVAAWLGLLSNLLLMTLKIVFGLLFGSQVLVADGVHNAADVIASIVSLSSMKISKIPADDDHPYGHGKAEVIASAFVSTLLIFASISIGYKAIESFFKIGSTFHIAVLIAAVISLFWKLALYFYTFNIAKKENSKSLLATAKDHLADVYASLAASVGILFVYLGEILHIPTFSYGDPIASLIVALFIFKMALHIGWESIDTLMEKSVPPRQLEIFINIIDKIPSVQRIDRVRAREHGHYILIDVRVGVKANLTIQEGHDISREIKESIMKDHPEVEEVLVHLNPWYEEKKDI